MVLISKEEAMAIRAKYGNDVGITVANRQKKSKRKRYYVEETQKVFFFLERFRRKQKREV